MKRMLTVVLCAALMLALCACGGDVSGVQTREVESEIYNDRDIASAINVIKGSSLSDGTAARSGRYTTPGTSGRRRRRAIISRSMRYTTRTSL